MKSIIQELQAGATDSKNSVTELLRKAKIVSSKLNLLDFLNWINYELSGYFDIKKEDVPSYRFIIGEPKAWNPYHGWVPILFDDSKMQTLISEVPIHQPVGELEHLYNSGSGQIHVPYPPELQQILRDAFNFKTKYTLTTQRTTVAGILDAVRNAILDWSLRLEKEGILGEGLSFSEEEKEKAHDAKTIVHINKIDNFVGNMGTMTDHSSISIKQINESKLEDIKNLAEQIKKYIDEAGLNKDDKTEVNRNLQGLELEIVKDNPEPSKISKFLSSIKRVFEGVTGNVIAQGIIAGIDKIII